MTFEESDMVGAVYLLHLMIVTSVGLGIDVITNKDTLDGSLVDLRIMLVLNEDKGLAADLSNP